MTMPWDSSFIYRKAIKAMIGRSVDIVFGLTLLLLLSAAAVVSAPVLLIEKYTHGNVQ